MKNSETNNIQSHSGNTMLSAVKLVYKQYKSDLHFVKNKSNIWKGKPYRWGFTHLSIATHWFYWLLIKR